MRTLEMYSARRITEDVNLWKDPSVVPVAAKRSAYVTAFSKNANE